MDQRSPFPSPSSDIVFPLVKIKIKIKILTKALGDRPETISRFSKKMKDVLLRLPAAFLLPPSVLEYFLTISGTERCPQKGVMKQVASKLLRALSEKGLALLVNHGIPEWKVR